MRTAACVLVLLAAAACSAGGEDASIEHGELGRLVLQPRDLPAAFTRFDQGRQLIGDSPGGRRADATRYGRLGGWKARYRRSGGANTRGPLVVDSKADVFGAVDGAKDDFGAARADLADSEPGWKPIDEPGLGDESFAATLVDGQVRYYQVFWRDANATATLNVNGFDGKLALADALELARAQERRISRAAE